MKAANPNGASASQPILMIAIMVMIATAPANTRPIQIEPPLLRRPDPCRCTLLQHNRLMFTNQPQSQSATDDCYSHNANDFTDRFRSIDLVQLTRRLLNRGRSGIGLI
jgi:hypothetical protein